MLANFSQSFSSRPLYFAQRLIIFVTKNFEAAVNSQPSYRGMALSTEARVINFVTYFIFILATFQKKLNLWDIAAGLLLVQEAGGITNDINLKNLNNIKIIATNSNINKEFQKKVLNF